MRRYVKYLIITSTTIILLTSFSLFYFNDSLLMDSIGHLPAHLGAGKMGRRRNIGHTSVKISDAPVQSNKHSFIGPQAVSALKHHSNRSMIGKSINPVIEPEHIKDRKDSKDRNSASMNGNKVLNSDTSDNAIGHGHNHNINADGPEQIMNGGQSIPVERHVKESKLNQLNRPPSSHVHDMKQLRDTPSQRNQQYTNQNSYTYNNNYLLSSLHVCSDPLCTSFLSERDLGNFTACRRRTQAAFSKRIAKTAKAQALSTNQLASRFSECRFMNGSGRSPVGLISFPGSGNTWVRGLLQKATGICTGTCRSLFM
jgi:hypothetical protein